MIPLSARLALPALLMFVLAAIPVYLHGDQRTRSDCRNPEALVDRLPKSDLLAMRPFVVHSFSPHELYGRPPGKVIASTYPESSIEMRDLVADGVTLPVHWISDVSQFAARVRFYFYVHGGKPVAHPFPSGLALAPRQLIDGTLPVTLFLIDGMTTQTSKIELLEQKAEEWIRKAWRHYQASCLP